MSVSFVLRLISDFLFINAPRNIENACPVTNFAYNGFAYKFVTGSLLFYALLLLSCFS
jgi:hypothetical protein